MAYADDIVLTTRLRKELVEIFKRLAHEAKTHDLNINEQKQYIELKTEEGEAHDLKVMSYLKQRMHISTRKFVQTHVSKITEIRQ